MTSLPYAFGRGTAHWLIALAAALAPASGQAMGSGITMTGAPPGFAELEHPRELLVDVYFGDRRLGDAWIVARPGFVKFRDPDHVLGLIPNLKISPALAERIAAEMEDNAGRACGPSNAQSCAGLQPELIAVIFSEDRFRLDLHVNPAILDVAHESDPYLPVPSAPLSLTSAIGGAIAGSTSSSPTYNFQNRTIVGFRNARIRSDSAFASDIGFIVDDLVAEVDTSRHRYSGGLFWAPGVDFTGRRRIAGLGFSTQFDTRSDADSLEATPLILFLGQPARVEVLIDGRLVSSGSYEAGNRAINSSSLPSGSYPLVLRIREPGGSVREERRFFVKNAAIAPVGQPVYFAYAGLLANTRPNSPISLSKSFYYQVGAARRLSDSLAVDAAILGTERKPLAQLGAWLITDLARVRAAALASTDGDAGVLRSARVVRDRPAQLQFRSSTGVEPERRAAHPPPDLRRQFRIGPTHWRAGRERLLRPGDRQPVGGAWRGLPQPDRIVPPRSRPQERLQHRPEPDLARSQSWGLPAGRDRRCAAQPEHERRLRRVQDPLHGRWLFDPRDDGICQPA